MNTLTSMESANSASTTIDIVPSQFALHIVQPGQPERTIPLASGKCTVGSSPRCQIQLASPQVRPLHCLIVHGATETAVTRWAVGALLNGQDFTTTAFRPGDCLRIGDVEVTLVVESLSDGVYESVAEKPTRPSPPKKPVRAETAIVEKAAAPTKPVTPSRLVTDLARPASFDSAKSAANSLESDRLVRQLWSANYGARQRCRQLVHSLRKVLGEREGISDELSRLQSESANREEQAAEELDRLISELSVAYEKSSEAEASSAEHVQKWNELRGELETLHTEREQLDQSHADNELQTSRLVQTLETCEQNISELESELAEAHAATELAEELGAQQTTHRERLEVETQQLQGEREQLQADFERALAATESAASQGTEQAAISDQLRAELEEMQLQQNELEETITEFQRYQPEWESAVAERDQRIGELLREVEQVHATILTLEEKDVEHVASVARIQEELSSLRQERDQWLGSQAEHLEHQQQWEQSLTERDRRLEEMQVEHKDVCEALEAFEQGAFEQIDACKQLEEQLAKVCEERDQIAAEQPEHEQQQLELEAMLQSRDQQIAELSEELGTLAQCRGELQSELEGQKSAAEQLESEVLELRGRCEDFSSNFDSSQQQHGELQQTFSSQQNELEQVRHQLEAAHQKREAFELTLAERTAKCEDFENSQAELQARWEQTATEHAAELERCQELESSLAQRQQSIMLFEADLQSVRAELQRSIDQTQQLEEKCGTAESQLAALQEELEAKDAHLVDAGEVDSALQQERDDLVGTLETTQRELTEAREYLLAAEKVLLNQATDQSSEPEVSVEAPASEDDAEGAISRLKEMSVWSETESSPANAEEFQAPEEETVKEEFTPASFIDQYDGEFEEDDSLDNEPPQELPMESHEPAIAELEEESDDAALEAYMQNMMRRVRGDSRSEEVSASLPQPEDTPTEDPVAMIDTAVERVASKSNVESDEPLSLEMLKRSSHKPDLPTDLSAMRELANSSARGAIAKHNKGRHLETAFSKFLLCLLATATAVYILLTGESYSSVHSIAGWVAAVIGAGWGIKMLGVLLEAIRAGSQQHRAAAEISGTVAEASCSDEG